MQWQVPNIIGVHFEGFGDHGLALGLIRFRLDLERELINLRVAIRTKIELA